MCAGALTTCDFAWNGGVSSWPVDVKTNYWAVEGFSSHGFTNGSRGGFVADGSAATVHHIAFINDVAYNVGIGFGGLDNGTSHDAPGATGFDYIAYVGDIAQNAEQNVVCTAQFAPLALPPSPLLPTPEPTSSYNGDFSYNTGNNSCGTARDIRCRARHAYRAGALPTYYPTGRSASSISKWNGSSLHPKTPTS